MKDIPCVTIVDLYKYPVIYETIMIQDVSVVLILYYAII